MARQWIIEWALDGRENELYIIQARPETVQKYQKPEHFRAL